MKIHLLVEGPADKAFLDSWLHRFLPQHHFIVHPHQGKGRLANPPRLKPDPLRRGLLDQLPATLAAYGKVLNSATDRVMVLLDADEEDCLLLKQRLIDLKKKIVPFPVILFRIAIRELEAFYLGDATAIKTAFPKARSSLLKTYRPDGDLATWEFFREVIGEPSDSENKRAWGERMGRTLGIDPIRNQSPSFRAFCAGLRHLCGEDAVSGQARPKIISRKSPRGST